MVGVSGDLEVVVAANDESLRVPVAVRGMRLEAPVSRMIVTGVVRVPNDISLATEQQNVQRPMLTGHRFVGAPVRVSNFPQRPIHGVVIPQ